MRNNSSTGVCRAWHRIAILALFGLPAFNANVSAQVTMAWSAVGDPGNAPDPLNGFGAVDHSYKIGTYDVTNNQYVEFLNAKDATGANALGLYNNSMSSVDGGIEFNSAAPDGSKYSVTSAAANHPVNLVTWFDALRFTNWLDNGQGSGSTETGAYTLLGGTPTPTNAAVITRNAGATVFLPNENEWYKAAFYSAATNSYYRYATSSNTAPTATAPTSTPNSANWNGAAGSQLTDVGAYSGTTSPYGAFDMAGNAYQWSDLLLGAFGEFLGTSYANITITDFRALTSDVGTGTANVGFRVASVPEPSTLILAALGGLALLAWRWQTAAAARCNLHAALNFARGLLPSTKQVLGLALFCIAALVSKPSAATFFDLRGIEFFAPTNDLTLTKDGITLRLEANSGLFVSTATSFGIDGTGAADAPDLVDGGNGLPETIAFLVSTEHLTDKIVLDSVLISQFDGDDAGLLNIKASPPVKFPLANGLNSVGLFVGQTSGNAISWTGPNSPGPTRGFSVDGISLHVVPEPSTLILTALGALALLAWKRQR